MCNAFTTIHHNPRTFWGPSHAVRCSCKPGRKIESSGRPPVGSATPTKNASFRIGSCHGCHGHSVTCFMGFSSWEFKQLPLLYRWSFSGLVGSPWLWDCSPHLQPDPPLEKKKVELNWLNWSTHRTPPLRSNSQGGTAHEVSQSQPRTSTGSRWIQDSFYFSLHFSLLWKQYENIWHGCCNSSFSSNLRLQPSQAIKIIPSI